MQIVSALVTGSDSAPALPFARPLSASTDAVTMCWSCFDCMRLQRQLEERALPGEARRWVLEGLYLAQLEFEEQERPHDDECVHEADQEAHTHDWAESC